MKNVHVMNTSFAVSAQELFQFSIFLSIKDNLITTEILAFDQIVPGLDYWHLNPNTQVSRI